MPAALLPAAEEAPAGSLLEPGGKGKAAHAGQISTADHACFLPFFCRYLNPEWQPEDGGQLRVYPFPQASAAQLYCAAKDLARGAACCVCTNTAGCTMSARCLQAAAVLITPPPAAAVAAHPLLHPLHCCRTSQPSLPCACCTPSCSCAGIRGHCAAERPHGAVFIDAPAAPRAAQHG